MPYVFMGDEEVTVVPEPAGQTGVHRPPARNAEEEQWLLLLDSAWEPAEPEDVPPPEVIVGMWPIGPEGETGKFRANPEYLPSDPRASSDPIDAALRALLDRRSGADTLRLLLRESLFDLALNGDGRPLVMSSPDRVLSLVVVTSEPHRMRLASPGWVRIDLDGLLSRLTEFDNVLINPGGPSSMRVPAGFLRRTAELTEADLAEIRAKRASAGAD